MSRSLYRTATILLCAGALVAASAAAQTGGDAQALDTQTQQMDSLATTRGSATVSGRISSDFSAFAGSTANADSLVSGLRSGSAITLTSTDAQGATTSTTFTPPTGQMGYGNVYTSLALAKQQLAALGVTDPTAQQIQAALVGGTVTGANGQTTTLTGVLTLRAQGMGWGQIAQSMGTKLGPVVSGMKSANTRIAAQPTGGSTAGTQAASDAGQGNAHGRGVVTGAGAPAAQGQGRAYGRGIVTGAGTAAGAGHGNAYGRGVVSGAGTPAGQAGGAQGRSAGKGN